MAFLLKRSLSAFLVSLVLSYVASAGMLLDRVVAVVNKDVITWGELHRMMEFKASDELKALGDAERMKVLKENEASFLQMMIDTKLQVQAARTLNVGASQEEIKEAIESIKKKYSMNDEEFQQSLKREGFTFDEYRKMLAEQIVLSKVVSHEVRSKIVVTDGDVSEYLAKHTEAGYRIRQVFLKKPEKQEQMAATEARANEIYARAKAGEDFSLLANRYSEDPSSRLGGDLGFVKKEYLGNEFRQVLSGMNAGDVSKPFWTSQGLHIIRLDEREDALSPDELQEKARKKLFESRFNEAYKSWLRGLREKAFVEVRL